jgi:hypothetical protein
MVYKTRGPTAFGSNVHRVQAQGAHKDD